MAEAEEAKVVTDEETVEAVVAESSLSDLFTDDEVEAEPEAETTAEVEAEAESDKGEKVAAATEEVEPPSTKQDSQGTQVPISALLAERLKRQKAEEQLEAFQKPEDVETPDPIEDPEGFKQSMQDQANRTMLEAKINISRSTMSSLKEDYAEKEQIFNSLVGEWDENGKLVRVIDPGLRDKFLASDNPSLFAYDHATEYLEIQKLKDPSYKETLRQEIRDELIAEFGQPVPDAAKVPDLTTATAAGSNSVPIEKEIEGIAELFDDSQL